LFFLAGHLLESTTIALELYFEHRNYVPSLLMFWPLGLWLADTRHMKVPKYILMAALPLGLAGMTHARATVWGDVRTQALLWARINPASARAQANAAQALIRSGQPHEAARQLETLLAAKPHESQLALNLLGARCATGGIDQADIATAHAAMRGSANTGALFAHWFERTLPVALDGSCPGLTPDVLIGLIDAGLANPRMADAGRQQDLTYLRGTVALARHRPDAALADFSRALNLQVRPALALKAAALLGSAGYPRQGIRLLDLYEQVKSRTMAPRTGMGTVHAWVLERQYYWPHEAAHLRRALTLDADAATVNTERSTSTSDHDR
jgi:tetratricopeptide (TPR) repeat protein